MPPLHRVRIVPHLSKGIIELNPWSRSYHTAIAKFTTIDPKGTPVSYNTGIMVGEPEENYVYVEPEIGNAIKLAILHQLGPGATTPTCHPKTLPLQFHHDSYHFAHKSVPLPRIDIFRNLGQLNCNISPATLWLSGNWHAITLDGTPDESFERMSRESASELKGALEKLKDR